MRWLCRLFLLLTFLAPTSILSADGLDAKWIWFDEGNPLESAPAGKVWFRREVRADEPSTGEIRIAADDPFILWVNGQKVGEGKGGEGFRFNLNGIVDRGVNAIAVQVDNQSGRAGLLVDGEVRSQGGRAIPFDSGSEWVATKDAPQGEAWTAGKFDPKGWKPVKVIADHANSPWKEIVFGDTYRDRIQPAEGFELIRIAEPDLVGSLVAFTWGNRGRIIASRERGPIISVIDENGDGIYDKVVEYSDQVKNCQGLCVVGNDLYAVGDGPQEAGLYRLPDANGDDKADSIEHLYKYRGGMGEHGPHDVVFGPDGWLYNNLGNHSYVTATPEKTSPVSPPYEGDLLQPRFEDAHGHAAGIKAPGGTVWRFSPDGKKWWLHTAGFRNQYDIAFNSAGELFTFDSDMEWDVGAPWYRPIRVNHCIPGAEFGWRSGTANWPAYYFDSLPGTVDIGRGSPTGVVFYEHTQFPQRFQGSFLICDWSMGRIIAAHLEPAGASYTGTWENLVVGNPLNVSDIEVDRDGSVVFSTGGRNTEGGLYRVQVTGAEQKAIAAETLDDAIRVPQMTSAWAREVATQVKAKLGDDWHKGLVEKAKRGTAAEQVRALTLMAQLGPAAPTELLVELTSDEDSGVRAFATWLLGDRPEPIVAQTLTRLLADSDSRVQRHACEAFVRSGLTPPVDPVLALFSRPDHWLRFAARLALEHIPADQWRMKILTSQEPRLVLDGLLALQHVSGLSNELLLEKELTLMNQWNALTAEQRLDTLRMIEVTLFHGAAGPVANQIGRQVLDHFPSGDVNLDMEAARIVAYLQVPGAPEKILTVLDAEKDHPRQVHYALTLNYIKGDWDVTLKGRLLNWYNSTRDWEGGHSFVPFLENIVGATIDRFSAPQRRELLERWAERPYATRLLFKRSSPAQVEDYDGVLARMIASIAQDPSLDPQDEMTSVIIDALARGSSDKAQELLRGLYETKPDQRDVIARALASHPSEANWTILLRGVASDDPTTIQTCLKALSKIEKKSDDPEVVRSVIVAGLKLGPKQQKLATDLLDKWTGANAIAYYQQWYKSTFPNAPAAELAAAPQTQSKYSYDQLINFLDRDPKGKAGDVERGKAIFAKANCVKCHQFLKDGQGIGPDLTSVRRRFQRKEIVESLVYPSKVISDQYKTVTVLTTDGLVHNGLPAKQEGSDRMTLWLSNATKVEIPMDEIEEQTPGRMSVMPEGLLDTLSLEEIADLFAFLETSKLNAVAEAAPNTQAAASPGGGQ